MLYDQWRQVAQEHRNELALSESASGRRWSFAGLDQLSERPPRGAEAMVCPQGHSAECIAEILRAWRLGAVVCPLEPDQKPPRVSLPQGACRHLKITSATSGRPRLIAFTETQLASDARTIVSTMGLRPGWPNLAAISMAHSYGFSNLVLPLLLHGIPLILAASPLPEMVRRAAEGHRDLTLAGVPALWRAWHEAKAIPANVRLAISAGAPLALELESLVHQAWGLKIHNFYGSSECGGIAYDGSEVPRVEDGLVGQAMEPVQLSQTPEGCLEVRSPAVGETYWPEPEPTLGQGCFQTTDLVELRDGAVYLRGRAGDLINIAGRKVSPVVIEQALAEHGAVRECLVFGVPDGLNERRDRIVACIVTNRPARAAELRKFLLAKLPAWQVPREWLFVETLAPNQRGKISRAEWRQRFLAGSNV